MKLRSKAFRFRVLYSENNCEKHFSDIYEEKPIFKQVMGTARQSGRYRISNQTGNCFEVIEMNCSNLKVKL